MASSTDVVAVVTGAGMGIGRGVAGAFAREGASVLVAEIDEAAGLETTQWLRDEWGAEAEFVRTDVTDKAQVVAMVDKSVERFRTPRHPGQQCLADFRFRSAREDDRRAICAAVSTWQ